MGVYLREPVNACTHLAWLLLAMPGTILLWQRGKGDRARQVSLLVYGFSLAFCYLGSVLFHSVRLPQPQLEGFDRLDHIGIFVLIAGSYTPLAWNLLSGLWRWGTLCASWSMTALGAAVIIAWGVLPPLVSTITYLVLGWGAIFCYLEISRELSHRRLWLLIAGGALYSVGAMINIVHWPVLWPHVFGSHELFHVFVMAGSLAHFWFMLTVVAAVAQVPERPARCAVRSQSVPLADRSLGARTI